MAITKLLDEALSKSSPEDFESKVKTTWSEFHSPLRAGNIGLYRMKREPKPDDLPPSRGNAYVFVQVDPTSSAPSQLFFIDRTTWPVRVKSVADKSLEKLFQQLYPELKSHQYPDTSALTAGQIESITAATGHNPYVEPINEALAKVGEVDPASTKFELKKDGSGAITGYSYEIGLKNGITLQQTAEKKAGVYESKTTLTSGKSTPLYAQDYRQFAEVQVLADMTAFRALHGHLDDQAFNALLAQQNIPVEAVRADNRHDQAYAKALKEAYQRYGVGVAVTMLKDSKGKDEGQGIYEADIQYASRHPYEATILMPPVGSTSTISSTSLVSNNPHRGGEGVYNAVIRWDDSVHCA